MQEASRLSNVLLNNCQNYFPMDDGYRTAVGNTLFESSSLGDEKRVWPGTLFIGEEDQNDRHEHHFDRSRIEDNWERL
jgi:hypothetical protein